MTVVVVTAADVSPIDPAYAEIFDGIALETITPGQVLYLDPTTGKYGVADANVAGKQQARGIATSYAYANQVVAVLKKGRVYGYTLTGNYDALVYLSDTAGAVDTAAGTMTVPLGRIVPVSDYSRTKVVFFDISWITTWS